MKKILWIVDGVGWGYDILSAAIAKELPQYEHVMLAKTRRFVVCRDGSTGFVCEGDMSFLKRLDEVDADMIVSMNPKNKRFLRDQSKAIIRFSGMRAMSGWKRF